MTARIEAVTDATRSLSEAVSAQRGHFRYESGHHGDLWLDLDSLLIDPRRTRGWAAALARKVAAGPSDLVCGPLTGGAFVAQLVAFELGARFVFAERSATSDGGARYTIPEALRPVVRGSSVLVVDDAVNAGSALVATVAELRACGAVIGGLASLLALGDAASRIARGCAAPFTAVLTLERGLWAPSACPLCAASALLTDPIAEKG